MAASTIGQARVHVVDLRFLDNASALKALATVRYGGLTISAVKVFHGSDKQPTIGLPQQQFERDGQTRYTDILRADKELFEEIAASVLNAYRRHADTNPDDLFGEDEVSE